MTFTIRVKVDTSNHQVKKECLEALAAFLNKKGLHFDVGYDPRELDLDSIGKA